jgi:DNA-binding MarR family transcriptional regulator
VSDGPAAVLDPILLEPKRLQICGALGVIDDMEFGTLRDLLGVADSVLSKHLKTLEEAGYVSTSKQKAGDTGRPRTWVKLTKAGRTAFLGHVAELRRLAQDVGAPSF